MRWWLWLTILLWIQIPKQASAQQCETLNRVVLVNTEFDHSCRNITIRNVTLAEYVQLTIALNFSDFSNFGANVTVQGLTIGRFAQLVFSWNRTSDLPVLTTAPHYVDVSDVMISTGQIRLEGTPPPGSTIRFAYMRMMMLLSELPSASSGHFPLLAMMNFSMWRSSLVLVHSVAEAVGPANGSATVAAVSFLSSTLIFVSDESSISVANCSFRQLVGLLFSTSVTVSANSSLAVYNSNGTDFIFFVSVGMFSVMNGSTFLLRQLRLTRLGGSDLMATFLEWSYLAILFNSSVFLWDVQAVGLTSKKPATGNAAIKMSSQLLIDTNSILSIGNGSTFNSTEGLLFVTQFTARTGSQFLMTDVQVVSSHSVAIVFGPVVVENRSSVLFSRVTASFGQIFLYMDTLQINASSTLSFDYLALFVRQSSNYAEAVSLRLVQMNRNSSLTVWHSANLSMTVVTLLELRTSSLFLVRNGSFSSSALICDAVNVRELSAIDISDILVKNASGAAVIEFKMGVNVEDASTLRIGQMGIDFLSNISALEMGGSSNSVAANSTLSLRNIQMHSAMNTNGMRVTGFLHVSSRSSVSVLDSLIFTLTVAALVVADQGRVEASSIQIISRGLLVLGLVNVSNRSSLVIRNVFIANGLATMNSLFVSLNSSILVTMMAITAPHSDGTAALIIGTRGTLRHEVRGGSLVVFEDVNISAAFPFYLREGEWAISENSTVLFSKCDFRAKTIDMLFQGQVSITDQSSFALKRCRLTANDTKSCAVQFIVALLIRNFSYFAISDGTVINTISSKLTTYSTTAIGFLLQFLTLISISGGSQLLLQDSDFISAGENGGGLWTYLTLLFSNGSFTVNRCNFSATILVLYLGLLTADGSGTAVQLFNSTLIGVDKTFNVFTLGLGRSDVIAFKTGAKLAIIDSTLHGATNGFSVNTARVLFSTGSAMVVEGSTITGIADAIFLNTEMTFAESSWLTIRTSVLNGGTNCINFGGNVTVAKSSYIALLSMTFSSTVANCWIRFSFSLNMSDSSRVDLQNISKRQDSVCSSFYSVFVQGPLSLHSASEFVITGGASCCIIAGCYKFVSSFALSNRSAFLMSAHACDAGTTVSTCLHFSSSVRLDDASRLVVANSSLTSLYTSVSFIGRIELFNQSIMRFVNLTTAAWGVGWACFYFSVDSASSGISLHDASIFFISGVNCSVENARGYLLSPNVTVSGSGLFLAACNRLQGRLITSVSAYPLNTTVLKCAADTASDSVSLSLSQTMSRGSASPSEFSSTARRTDTSGYSGSSSAIESSTAIISRTFSASVSGSASLTASLSLELPIRRKHLPLTSPVLVTLSAFSSSATLPSAAMAVQRTVLLQSLVACDFSLEDELDVSSNPTRMAVGGPVNRFIRGSVVGNWLFWVGIALGLYGSCLAWALRAGQAWSCSTDKAALPGLMVAPVVFLLQPTLSSSVALVVHSADDGDSALGVVSCVLVLVILGLVTVLCTSRFGSIKILREEEENDDELSPWQRRVLGLLLYLFDDGLEWQDTIPRFTARYGKLFEPYRAGMHGFAVFELLNCAVTGVLGGIMPKTDEECNGILILLCAQSSLCLAAVLWCRPYGGRADSFVSVFAGVCSLLMAVMALVGDEIATGTTAAIIVYTSLLGAVAFVAHVLVLTRLHRKVSSLLHQGISFFRGLPNEGSCESPRKSAGDAETECETVAQANGLKDGLHTQPYADEQGRPALAFGVSGQTRRRGELLVALQRVMNEALDSGRKRCPRRVASALEVLVECSACSRELGLLQNGGDTYFGE